MSRPHRICYVLALACGLALMALSVMAQTISLSGTTITLRDTDHAGAEAEIVMDNRQVNGPSDEGEYTLSLRDLTVWLTFIWDTGSEGQDTISVVPPDGMICAPSSCMLEVKEDDAGTLLLIPWEGM